MIQRYRTSGYLQLLDEEPAPLETREDKLKKERLSRAAEQKRQFLEELKIRQLHVMLDHNYTLQTMKPGEMFKTPGVLENQYLIRELYINYVCIDHAPIVNFKS